jgi:hypothetical protein
LSGSGLPSLRRTGTEEAKKLNEINMRVRVRDSPLSKRSAKWFGCSRLENHVVSMAYDFRAKWL